MKNFFFFFYFYREAVLIIRRQKMVEIANTSCRNGQKVIRETILAVFDRTSALYATRSPWTLCCTPAVICVCVTIALASYGVEVKATATVQFAELSLRTSLGRTNRDDGIFILSRKA